MSSADVHVVILGAGQGTRMKSALPKVLHSLAGRALVERVLDTAAALGPATTLLVVGHGAEAVKQRLAHRSGLLFVTQQPQLGTAHALRQTERVLSGKTGTLILLSGDVPLLRAMTLKALIDVHRAAGAAATVVTAIGRTPLRLRANRAIRWRDLAYRGGARRLVRGARDPRRSTAASTPSTWHRSSRPCRASPPRTRRASTT